MEADEAGSARGQNLQVNLNFRNKITVDRLPAPSAIDADIADKNNYPR